MWENRVERAGLELLGSRKAAPYLSGRVPARQLVPVERVQLQSKAIASAGYDGQARVLEVEFTSGRIYRYTDVPSSVYEWLVRTPNKGAYLSRMVEGRYPYSEVIEAPPAADLVEALRASIRRLDDSDA